VNYRSYAPARVKAGLSWTAIESPGLPGAGLEPARGFPQGIFLPATAFAAVPKGSSPAARSFRDIWGLDFTFAVRRPTGRSLGRGRQVSTLSATPRRQGLARYCRRNCASVPPTLTPFTPGVSRPGCSMAQVPCVYRFRHPGKGVRLRILQKSRWDGCDIRSSAYGAKPLNWRE